MMDRAFLFRNVCLFIPSAPEPVKLEIANIRHICEGDKCFMADRPRSVGVPVEHLVSEASSPEPFILRGDLEQPFNFIFLMEVRRLDRRLVNTCSLD